ncbi:MAG: tripartite tricarboxylate transporter substrate-binding protein [Pseudohongiellaceae bacterium]
MKCVRLLLVLVWMWMPPSTGAQDSADAEAFYRGKNITYLVSGSIGNGYDLYARLITKYMERHLPETSIRVQNVQRAGGILAANQIYSATPDGLTLGSLNAGLVYIQLQGVEGANFDLAKFEWVGKAGSDPRVIFTGNSGKFQNFEEMLVADKPLLFVSTSGIGTSAHNESLILARALGLDMRLVVYRTSNDSLMSLFRGEVDARVSSYSTARRYVQSGSARVLAKIGNQIPGLDSVPDVYDYTVDDSARRLLNLIENTSSLTRYTVMTPGVDPHRVAYMRQIYRDALSDPRLLAEAESLELPIEPAYGEELQNMIDEVLNQPQSTIQSIRASLQ